MVSNLKDYHLSVLTQIGSISSFEICEIKVLQGIEEKINLVKSVFLLKGKKAITHSVATRALSYTQYAVLQFSRKRLGEEINNGRCFSDVI